MMDQPAKFAAILAMGLVIGAAGAAALTRNSRSAIVALWLSQLGAGALLLASGSEVMAVLVWLVSSVVAAVYFLHADVVGDPEVLQAPRSSAAKARLVLPAIVSAGTGVMTWALLAGLVGDAPAGAVGTAARATSYARAEERFLLVELVALIGLAAAVGAGVISRQRRKGGAK